MQFKEKKTKDGKDSFVFSKVVKTEDKVYSVDELDHQKVVYTKRKERAEASLLEANEMLAEIAKAKGLVEENKELVAKPAK